MCSLWFLFGFDSEDYLSVRDWRITHFCGIISISLSSGIFPTRLKFSIVEPVFKNGGRFDISNFRAISIFTSFSKVFENIIYARLYQHISQNNIYVNEKYVCRSE